MKTIKKICECGCLLYPVVNVDNEQIGVTHALDDADYHDAFFIGAKKPLLPKLICFVKHKYKLLYYEGIYGGEVAYAKCLRCDNTVYRYINRKKHGKIIDKLLREDHGKEKSNKEKRRVKS